MHVTACATNLPDMSEKSQVHIYERKLHAEMTGIELGVQ